MYIPCVCPYIEHFFHSMFLLSLLCSSGILFSKIPIFINLASVRCNNTKPASGKLPWGAPITDTENPIRSKLYSLQPLRPHTQIHRGPIPLYNTVTDTIETWHLTILIPISQLSSLPDATNNTNREVQNQSVENKQE